MLLVLRHRPYCCAYVVHTLLLLLQLVRHCQCWYGPLLPTIIFRRRSSHHVRIDASSEQYRLTAKEENQPSKNTVALLKIRVHWKSRGVVFTAIIAVLPYLYPIICRQDRWPGNKTSKQRRRAADREPAASKNRRWYYWRVRLMGTLWV